MSVQLPKDWIETSVRELEHAGHIELGRGKIISQKDIEAHPGDYPVYSSSARGNGEFGRYGKFMFDEELVTWSVDGGGKFFYRPKSRYSITNVSGFLRVTAKAKLDTYYTWAHLFCIWQTMTFNYTEKLHPSILRERFSFSYPPLPEQKKIAHILSTVQRAIEAQERIILTTIELKKALMQKLFTEGLRGEPQKQTEIGPVPESWEVVAFDKFVTLQRGYDLRKQDFREGQVPVIGATQVIGYHDTANVKAPGVTVVRSGSSAGKPLFIAEDFWAHNVLLYVKDFQRNVPKFVYYKILALDLTQYRQGVAVPTLNRNTFSAVELALPSPAEQQEIADALDAVGNRTEVAERKKIQLEDLFRTLLNELMTAMTRVHRITLSDNNHE
jgi:type I restriction enzyme S subunit